jgi:hypothetical protein
VEPISLPGTERIWKGSRPHILKCGSILSDHWGEGLGFRVDRSFLLQHGIQEDLLVRE